MEQSLNVMPARRPTARIAFARTRQSIGAAGLLGLLLFAAATFVGVAAQVKSADAQAVLHSVAIATPTRETAPSEPPQHDTINLPRRDQIPLLLTRMQRAAVDNGLPWTAAEYRLSPATEHDPARLDVRFAVKAPYPKTRAMLADLIGMVPALTIREMSFSRQSTDTLDVDAKFVIGMFVADSEAPAPQRGDR